MGKVKFEKTEIFGLVPAMRGMRNPLDSWHLNDSHYRWGETYEGSIGEVDLKLAQKLVRAGGEHSKFLRQIQVWVDVTMPRYIWSEWDTYKFQVKNSCSTMHTIFKYPITDEHFIIPEKREGYYMLHQIIAYLNDLRMRYCIESDPAIKNMLRHEAKKILPESFLQMRTINVNYAELMNMYHQRKNHRLPEWQVFCAWCETLPYFKELCIDTVEVRK